MPGIVIVFRCGWTWMGEGGVVDPSGTMGSCPSDDGISVFVRDTEGDENFDVTPISIEDCFPKEDFDGEIDKPPGKDDGEEPVGNRTDG
jgi:hypothetical protein